MTTLTTVPTGHARHVGDRGEAPVMADTEEKARKAGICKVNEILPAVTLPETAADIRMLHEDGERA